MLNEIGRDEKGFATFIPESRKLNDENCAVGLPVTHRSPRSGSAVIIEVEELETRVPDKKIRVRWDIDDSESNWMNRNDFYISEVKAS